jgi:glycosyltransferase involved in cell wall biosynthesis
MGGGVSNALLEQMAAGKPQIVWDNPIYRNVADESFAIFARERDAEALASGIEQMWLCREQFHTMSESAADRATAFGWKHHISKAADAFFGDGSR